MVTEGALRANPRLEVVQVGPPRYFHYKGDDGRSPVREAKPGDQRSQDGQPNDPQPRGNPLSGIRARLREGGDFRLATGLGGLSAPFGHDEVVGASHPRNSFGTGFGSPSR